MKWKHCHVACPHCSSYILGPGEGRLLRWARATLQHHIIPSFHREIAIDPIVGVLPAGHAGALKIWNWSRSKEARWAINEAGKLDTRSKCHLESLGCIFAVMAAAKLSGLWSTFECIGSSMNGSLGHKLYQAINNDDNRLHLIEVFREAVLWITTHFLFHPDRWLMSIWLLASLPLLHSFSPF